VAWEKVLLQEPHNQTLYTRVADALAVEGDAARAETYYRRCLAIGFDQYAWLGLAHLAYEAGRYAEAEDCCHQILRHVPGSSRALKLLSRIYDVRGESSKADEIRQQLATHSR
jgi:Tfp pilus assembly protein PilF